MDTGDGSGVVSDQGEETVLQETPELHLTIVETTDQKIIRYEHGLHCVPAF